MSGFQELRGTILVGDSAEDLEHVEGGEHLYDEAVFVSDRLALRFKDGTGRYYKISDEAFRTEDGEVYFHPYHNETTVRIAVSVDHRNLTVLRDNVTLQYLDTQDGLFIRSQNEVPAYAPNYVIVDETLYRIHTPMLMGERPDVSADDFLELDGVDDALSVENVHTGARAPIPDDKVRPLVTNDEPNGALELRTPKDVIDEVRRALDRE